MNVLRDLYRTTGSCITYFKSIQSVTGCGSCSRIRNLCIRQLNTRTSHRDLAFYVAKSSPPSGKFLSRILADIIKSRRYGTGTGEYEKLWAAATGGRGVGRGRKKKIKKGAEPGVLQFGKANLTWPGLTKPIVISEESEELNMKQFYDKRRSGIPVLRSGPPRYGNFISSERGWTGNSLGGKRAGAPLSPAGDPLAGFDSIIMEVRKMGAQTDRGRQRFFRALVVCGNGKGAIGGIATSTVLAVQPYNRKISNLSGWAIGTSSQARSAVWKARNKAGNYIQCFEVCDGHTIFHNLESSYFKTKIKMERRPPGNGIKAHRIVKAIAELAGIKDLYSKTNEKTTPMSVVRAAFAGFLSQETHAELAERTGKNVVEFRQEMGNLPVVVASPSEEAVLRRIEREKNMKEEDELAAAFDPSRGLHKAKRFKQRKEKEMLLNS